MLTPLECFRRKKQQLLPVFTEIVFALHHLTIDLYISKRRSSPSMNLRLEALLPEHHPGKHPIVVNPGFPSTPQKNCWEKKTRQNLGIFPQFSVYKNRKLLETTI